MIFVVESWYFEFVYNGVGDIVKVGVEFLWLGGRGSDFFNVGIWC